MPLQRVKVVSSNFGGAPGYYNFYFTVGTPPPLTALRTLFFSMNAFIPSGMTFTYPASGDIISEATGQITDAWTATPPSNSTGTGAGAYPGGSGLVWEWKTSTVLDGRRPIGKTFLVPLIGTAFDTDGSLAPTVVSSATSAAAAFVTATAGQFCVWHRPKRDKVTGDITRVGGVAVVSSSSVPDLAAAMSTRRR